MLRRMIIALICICLTGCEDSSVDPNDGKPQEVISISGSVDAISTGINRVGLFSPQLGHAVGIDDATHFTAADVTGPDWTLSIPDMSAHIDAHRVPYLGSTGGRSIYGFVIIGWADLDEDGKYDPQSGEPAGYAHINGDTLHYAELFYIDNREADMSDNWFVESLNLRESAPDWFILDHSQAAPLTTWIYRDSIYTFSSGLAERKLELYGTPIDGMIVYLSTMELNCDEYPSVVGGLLKVTIPNLDYRPYGRLEINGDMAARRPRLSNINGNIGTAGLTFVDTLVAKRVRGWIAFDASGGFTEDEVSQAYGTFDVPYCSGD